MRITSVTQWAILLGMLMGLSSCAAIRENWRQETCSYDGSYEMGMNEARRGEEMNSHFVNQCPEPTRAEAKRGYREGFAAGAQGLSLSYSQSGSNAVRGPGWKCQSAYGQKKCGYHCIEAFGQIACAQQPHHKCVEAFGNVRCGLNCRAEFGDIVCD